MITQPQTPQVKMLTEPELRALRDQVYGPGSDAEWAKCKANWSRPDSVKFLQAEAVKIQRREHRDLATALSL